MGSANKETGEAKFTKSYPNETHGKTEFIGQISEDLTMFRGWFKYKYHNQRVEGNFDLNRNETKKATVEKTYKDENWKDTGKIAGLYNDYFSEFTSDQDFDEYSDISFKATQRTENAYLLFVIEDMDARIYVQNEDSKQENKKVFVACALKA